MKRIIVVALSIILSLPSLSTAQINKNKFSKSDRLFVFNPNHSLQKKKAMQDSAFANNSMAPNFIVITATNQKTGVTKQLCTEAPFIDGGLERNQPKIIPKKNKANETIYLFNTKAALNNVGFYDYSYSDLLAYSRKQEIRKVVSLLLTSQTSLSYTFRGTTTEQHMFAHILFNNGIASTRGSLAGNFMELKKAN